MCSLPKCYFKKDTMTAIVGNTIKGTRELKCFKVPTFYSYKTERESLGGGWKGDYVTQKVENDNFYIIMDSEKPYGLLIQPFTKGKSDILPVGKAWAMKQAKKVGYL